MTALNDPLVLMSRWLLSTNKSDSSLKFTAYYKAVTKSLGLQNFIQGKLVRAWNLNGSPDEIAKNILQDLMLQHIQQVQIERTLGAERIIQIADNLTLNGRGEFYSKQITQWSKEVKDWVIMAGSFYQRCAQSPETEDWHKEADDINRQWTELGKIGGFLLNWALTETSENDSGDDDQESHQIEFLESLIEGSSTHDDNKNDAEYLKRIRNLISQTKKQINKEGQESVDKSLDVMGGTQFILDVGEILRLGNKVKIFKAYYLRIQAQQLIFDYFKKCSNKLEETIFDGNDDEDSETEKNNKKNDEDESDTQIRDYVEKLMEIDFLLSAPLRDCKKEFEQAKTDSEMKLLNAKYLKLIERKNDMELVIQHAFDGCTQDEIATNIGITRDKVRGLQKCIKELLKPLND